MLEKIKMIENRLKDIDEELIHAGGDYERIAELGKERAEIEPLVLRGQEYRQTLDNLEQARELANSEEAELAELAIIEIQTLEPIIEKLADEIKTMLLPKDPRDDRNVIVEIRADLFRMYTR
jgi:peptide chain release factor 1